MCQHLCRINTHVPLTWILFPPQSWTLSLLPTADLPLVLPVVAGTDRQISVLCTAEPVSLGGGSSASSGGSPSSPIQATDKISRVVRPRTRSLRQALENSRCPLISCHLRVSPRLPGSQPHLSVPTGSVTLWRKASTPTSSSPASWRERDPRQVDEALFALSRPAGVWRGNPQSSWSSEVGP